LSPGEKLWKVWWLWGIPVAWSASAMLIAAEEFRLSGLPAAGDALDVARLAIYWFWCRRVWRCSANTGNRAWTVLSKAVLSAGLALTVLT
jgi:hypothetical protein